MRLVDVAYKNVKGNVYRYIMYFLSNTLAVMVFFIFANFIFNPSVRDAKNIGTPGALTGMGMIMCEVVIVIFSFFFISYSVTNFLKSREKEFGLLSLFGMTKSQIRFYVLYENMLISALSITVGVFLGVLFSKLFFLAISVILQLKKEIPFSISPQALLVSTFGFLVLFQILNALCVLRIKNRNIAELLKGSRVPKPTPGFSVVKAIAGILLLAAGYTLALISHMAIMLTMFPILILTVAGTFFLYSQFSVFFTGMLQKRYGIFYKGTNLIALSQIMFKLKDNARVLFLVSILGAVTVTAAGTVYCLQEGIRDSAVLNNPQDMGFYEQGEAHSIIQPSRLEEIVVSHGRRVTAKSRLPVLKAVNAEKYVFAPGKKNLYFGVNTKDFLIMPAGEYNLQADLLKMDRITLKGDETMVRTYQESKPAGYLFMGRKLKLKTVGTETILNVVFEKRGGIINPIKGNYSIAVVSDEKFKTLATSAKELEKLTYYGFNISDWENAADTVRDVIKELTPEAKKSFTERVTEYSNLIQVTSIMLFIGMFIAILFFIATGSVIYFKMFSEIQKDRSEFQALKKIGMTNGEMKRIISVQTAVMFFLPFIVALLHASFALAALENLILLGILEYTIKVYLVYFVLQALYFLFARTVYIRQVKYIWD